MHGGMYCGNPASHCLILPFGLCVAHASCKCCLHPFFRSRLRKAHAHGVTYPSTAASAEVRVHARLARRLSHAAKPLPHQLLILRTSGYGLVHGAFTCGTPQ